MKHVPSVSVLVPAHNEEKYIGRCIRSLLNQSLRTEDFEIVVINDGSTDRTRYALDVFGDAIRVVHNETSVGLPASLNKGIQSARGRYIVRLDADDYVNADYLNVLALFLNLNPTMDAVACDYLLVDDEENVLGRRDCMAEPLGCGIMFRAEHLIDIGMYDPQFRLNEDKDLRIRFLKKYRIHRVELPLYRYRRHDGNMTNDVGTRAKYDRALQQKHEELLQ